MASPAELLQWVNVLIIPALVYIVKLERRILALEIRLGIALEKLTGKPSPAA